MIFWTTKVLRRSAAVVATEREGHRSPRNERAATREAAIGGASLRPGGGRRSPEAALPNAYKDCN
jgi:hypothetical protein